MTMAAESDIARSAVIAAPPWAARGLAEMVESGMIDAGLRHVVVDDGGVDPADAAGYGAVELGGSAAADHADVPAVSGFAQ